jgi:acetyltransferase-like isoleucine patch superfamily enzyme
LQAGSVVVHDIPRLGIAGGNPAKVFKYRDENNFDLLAKNNEFLYL